MSRKKTCEKYLNYYNDHILSLLVNHRSINEGCALHWLTLVENGSGPFKYLWDRSSN